MKPRLILSLAALLSAFVFCIGDSAQAKSVSCETSARSLSSRLKQQIDVNELADILKTLIETQNRSLPSKFITKRDAEAKGWRPGRDLWSVPALRGKSIGGDYFGNREKRLPAGKWKEADLDYKGGHRGSKRLIFSESGRRFVTVDHYNTFIEAEPCS